MNNLLTLHFRVSIFMKVIVVYPVFQEAQANQACVSFVSSKRCQNKRAKTWSKRVKCSLYLILGGLRGVQGEVGVMGQKGNDGQQGAPGIQVWKWLLLNYGREKYILCLELRKPFCWMIQRFYDNGSPSFIEHWWKISSIRFIKSPFKY